MARRSIVLATGLAAALAACGDGGGAAPDAGGPRDWPLMTVPTSDVPEAGIRRELFRVQGVVPPANPTTGATTPAELNFTQVVRYRQDVDSPAPATAVIIAMPGFLGAAGNWDPLARNLVRESIARGAPVEVWAIDRRSNLLEDLRGMDSAEAARNAEIAQGYYFGGETVGGQAFAGFVDPADVSFMSEWGLATHVEDLRRVIAVVPQAQRKARVFLLGHSLGGALTEAYASWRFDDGTHGFDELAGFALIDGSLTGTPISESDYHDGVANGFFSLTGVDDIRATTPYFELPILGTDVLPQAEIMSMRYLYDPTGVIVDARRDHTLQILLMVSPVPKMTNAATLGFAFDHESEALTFAACSCGHASGGALETYDNAIAQRQLVRPSDQAATYDWVDAPDAQPPEVTPLADLAHAFVDGRVNLAEWYFPSRLPLDLRACSNGQVAPGGYQDQAGLRCFDEALVDAPFLGVSAELAPIENLDATKDRVAPTIGPGRPLAGHDRSDPNAFRTFHIDGFTHMDGLLAAAGPGNPVPGAVLDFVAANAAPGDVTIPVQPAP
jgi:pimeloyl-ACP methyl ester carboxylesterase